MLLWLAMCPNKLSFSECKLDFASFRKSASKIRLICKGTKVRVSTTRH